MPYATTDDDIRLHYEEAGKGTPIVFDGLPVRSADGVIVYGLLVPLSLDNVVAGTSLGLLGYSLWLAPVMFGATTAVVAFVGLRIGRTAASFIRIRPDLLTGAALLIMAVVLGPNS